MRSDGAQRDVPFYIEHGPDDTWIDPDGNEWVVRVMRTDGSIELRQSATGRIQLFASGWPHDFVLSRWTKVSSAVTENRMRWSSEG